MSYNELLIEADSLSLITKEKPLRANNGRIKGNKIAIRIDLETTIEKKCVLAEELGHHFTSVGTITDLEDIKSKKQEEIARLWAYNKLIGLRGIISAYENGCRDFHEIADFLDVTEEFLHEALEKYKSKYGLAAKFDNYVVGFEPNLYILKLI